MAEGFGLGGRGVGTVLDRFVTEFAFVGDTAALDTIERRVQATQQRLDRASRSMMRVGAVGTAALVGIIRSAAQADSALRSLQARTGANESQLAAFSTQAKNVSATLPLMTRDVILGQRAYLQLGNTIENTLAATPALARFTAAAADSGVTMETAARFATVATKAWGLAAEDTGRITDVLLKAQTKSAADAYQLGQAFQYSAQSAADAGLSLEGYVSILGGLAESGREVEAASQGLQLFLSNIARAREGGFRGGELVAKAFGRVGIDRAQLEALTSQGDRGYFQLLDLMRQRTADDLNLRIAILTQLSGTSYASALSAAIANLPDLRSDYEHLLGAQGETQRQADIMMQGLSGAINLARSAIDVFVLGLADVGISAFGKSVIDTFTSVVAWLGKTDEATNELVNGGILRLISGGLILSAGLVGLGGALQVVSWSLGGYLAIARAAHIVTGIWTAKQWALNAAFWANPVGVVVAGVVALGVAAAAVWYYWDNIANLWRRLWGMKPTADMTPAGEFQKAGQSIPKTIADGINRGGGQVMADALNEQLQPVDRMLPKSDALEGPLSRLTEAGASIPRTIAEGIRSEGDQGWVFENAYQSALDWLYNLDLFETGRTWIDRLLAGIWSMKDSIVAAFRRVFEPLLPESDALTGPLSRLTEAGEAIPATIARGIARAEPVRIPQGAINFADMLARADAYSVGVRNWYLRQIPDVEARDPTRALVPFPGRRPAEGILATQPADAALALPLASLVARSPAEAIAPLLTAPPAITGGLVSPSAIAAAALLAPLVARTPASRITPLPTAPPGSPPLITGVTAPLPVAPVHPPPPPRRPTRVTVGEDEGEDIQGGACVINIDTLVINAEDEEGGERAAEAFMDYIGQQGRVAVQQWDSPRAL